MNRYKIDSFVIVVLLACLQLIALPVRADGQSACAADLDADGFVGGGDLSILLNAWGGGAPDLDGDGHVGGADLAILLGTWGACGIEVSIHGYARFTDGSPASGGAVTSSAGGSAVVRAEGDFLLTVIVPPDTSSIRVEVAASRMEIAHQGQVTILLDGATSRVSADIAVAPSIECDDAGWQPTFGGAVGLAGGLSGPGDPLIHAIEQFDDGSGAAIFVGGNFRTAGGAVVNSVGKWDGNRWLPTGMNEADGYWYDFEACDLGSGPQLYAIMRALPLHQGVMRWTGSTWEPLGGGFQLGSNIRYKLLGHDDGSGRQLYVAGGFSSASGVQVSNIARWNGAVWSPVGAGLNGAVNDLAEYDDGTGLALYAAGSFTFSGTTAVNGIAKWDGKSWHAVGGGLSGGFVNAQCLAVFDDGNGARLYVASGFSGAGDVAANKCASWDGSGWRAESIPTQPAVTWNANTIWDLEVFDSGTGPALYAGFNGVGSNAGGLIRRDGQNSWTQVGSFSGSVRRLQRIVLGGTPMLCMGHHSTLYSGFVDTPDAGRLDTNGIVAWDGQNWSNFGRGMNGAAVRASAFCDDGTGPVLYLGGDFRSVDNLAVNRIARWRDGAWSPLGSGTNGTVRAIIDFNDGNGPGVVVGGDFTTAGGLTRNRIALWRNGGWHALGSGFSSGTVHALAVFQGELYAAGSISGRVARFTGGSWQVVGGGTNNVVRSLLTMDPGDGPRLYAGGDFSIAGGASAARVAWWDGATWTGVPGIVQGNVFALAAHDHGSGLALVAGGNFVTDGAAAPAARGLAVLSSGIWRAIGGSVNGSVNAITAVCTPSGTALYIGGSFDNVASVPAANIARWNGSVWSSVGTGTTGALPWGFSQNTVESIGVMGGAMGSSVIVTGYFPSTPGGDSFVARIGCE